MPIGKHIIEHEILNVPTHEDIAEATHHHNTDYVPPEVPDGTTVTHFTTDQPFILTTLCVFMNGSLREKGVVYTENVDGQSYDFVAPPPAGSKIEHHYIVDEG